MGLMKCKILQILLTKRCTFYPEKSVYTLPCLSLSSTSLSQTPSPCTYPQTAYNYHNDTILYANIFIEVH